MVSTMCGYILHCIHLQTWNEYEALHLLIVLQHINTWDMLIYKAGFAGATLALWSTILAFTPATLCVKHTIVCGPREAFLHLYGCLVILRHLASMPERAGSLNRKTLLRPCKHCHQIRP